VVLGHVIGRVVRADSPAALRLFLIYRALRTHRIGNSPVEIWAHSPVAANLFANMFSLRFATA
jgi:hypothetical protein